MLVDGACDLFSIPVNGVIHVGANQAREYDRYLKNGVRELLYVEAIPSWVDFIRTKLDASRRHFVRQAVVSDTSGEHVKFNVASNEGKSSSLLPLGSHSEIYPHVSYSETIDLVTERLDDIVESEYADAGFNVLVLDVQGAELKVLAGAVKLLSRVDAVFSEVAGEALYAGGCTFQDVANFLSYHGLMFRSAELNLFGWGDAFFTRQHSVLDLYLKHNLARGGICRQSSTFRADLKPDGVVSGVLPAGFGVHTAVSDRRPWWEVDLRSLQPVKRILYLDRRGFEKRGAALQLLLSDDGREYRCIYDRKTRALRTIIDVELNTVARYIRVVLPQGGPLHFRQLIAL
jgi:FkbM family methyltransferase